MENSPRDFWGPCSVLILDLDASYSLGENSSRRTIIISISFRTYSIFKLIVYIKNPAQINGWPKCGISMQ